MKCVENFSLSYTFPTCMKSDFLPSGKNSTVGIVQRLSVWMDTGDTANCIIIFMNACMGMCVCECVCECIKVHADSIDYYYADTSWTYSTGAHIIIILLL